MTHWITLEWWKYLLQPVSTQGEGWLFRFQVYVCRARGHPYGVIFYNPNGIEPDMTCKNCGDDLG